MPSFDLLLTAFDPDRDRAGARYRDLHRRLVQFFDRQAVQAPEEQADEVLDRLLRKLAAGEQIANLPAYARGVARCVMLEARKKSEREAEMLRLIADRERARMPRGDVDDSESRQQAFEQCLAALTPENRSIILGYYTGERRAKIETRRQLAASLGIDLNALRVRAHRIRTQLESSMASRSAAHVMFSCGMPHVRGSGK